jgi:hypothetical protein
MSPDPIARRNAGLRRISTITTGALAGGLVLTGGLSVLAARSFSGTSAATTQSTTATTAPPTSSSSSSSSSSTSSSDDTLQAPSYYVQPSSGSGRVRSGGS